MQPTPDDGFASLWTGWSNVSQESLAKESQGLTAVQQDFAAANARRMAQLRSQGRALGERVGRIVREGDCDDGERVAREAGDFALVQAVRQYCRQRQPESAASSR
ncbi:MAG: hypothetical protein ACT4OE_01075 [Sphingosinicella sp.]